MEVAPGCAVFRIALAPGPAMPNATPAPIMQPGQRQHRSSGGVDRDLGWHRQGPRGPAEPCGTLEAGESGCPSPAPSAHVALDGGGRRGRCPRCCQGKCSLRKGLAGGGVWQDPAGSGRVWQAGGQAGSTARSRRKVVSSASCGSAGLVSPAEQPLALTAKPVCEY